MNKHQALQSFLVATFTPQELRRMFLYNGLEVVANDIPAGVSMVDMVAAAIESLQRRRLLTHATFDVFRAERPEVVADLDHIEQLWTNSGDTRDPPRPPTKPRTFRWLEDSVLDGLVSSLMEVGLPLESLVGGLPRSYVGTLPDLPIPNARLLAALTEMNGVRKLADGTVPLVRVLKNAALLTSGQMVEAVFAQALAQIDVVAAETPSA